jgi:large subunit ribosomal protein L10
MPRPEKVQAVAEIRSRLDEARATFVTEYRGLTVGEQQELRRSVQKAQGEYQVLKMSLARLATEGMDVEGLNELLVGPTALAFANTDPVPVAKVLRDFANEHDKLIIKGGILGGTMLPPEQITRLADIEPRDVLLSKVAGGFKAPMAKLAGLLGAKMRDAASMFSQLLEKKEADAPVVEEAPVAVPEPATEEASAAVVEEAAEVVAEEASAAVVEEAAEVVAEEASAAVVDEAAEVVAEEASAAVVEEAAEVVAEEASAAVVDEAAEVVAEEASAAVVEEAAEVVAEEASAAVVEEAAEVVTDEAPDADASPDIETTDQPKPKKKAAPKAKAQKSPAKADADAASADGSDDTAEEE